MDTANQTFDSVHHRTVLDHMEKMWKILPVIIIVASFIESFLYFFVSGNPLYENDVNFALKEWSVFHAYIPTILTSISYLITRSLYLRKKTNFHMKKTYFQAMLYCMAVSYVFGHYAFTSLQILFVIPILVSTVFSRTAVRRSFIYSSLFELLYGFHFGIAKDSVFYIANAFVVEIILVLAALIAISINKQFRLSLDKTIEYVNYVVQLTTQLHFDSLVGCYSRDKLQEDIENKTYSSIAFIDFDDFKICNDKFGHHIGDWVLQVFGKALMTPDISLYRYGGDEFIVASSLSSEELRQTLVYLFENFKYEVRKKLSSEITVSCGIVETKEFTMDFIKKADAVMYEAKRSGKNKIQILKNL